jgi:DNA repair protein RadC
MLLKDLPQDARPREKLLARGPGALSDAELLALLLRTGLPGKNALQMGEELLFAFGGVSGLLSTPAEALKKIKGLGPAKRAEIVAVLELARRALASQLQEKPLFGNPQAIRDYLQLQLGSREHEVFAVLFLDTQHRLIENAKFN